MLTIVFYFFFFKTIIDKTLVPILKLRSANSKNLFKTPILIFDFIIFRNPSNRETSNQFIRNEKRY